MSTAQIFSTILESHYYGTNGVAIRYSTRNICSDATAKILEEMARILFPNEAIEIYVLPAEDGCHKDSFWIKFTNNPMAVTISGVLLTALFAYPLTSSQIKVNQSQDELNLLQIEQIKSEMKAKNIQTTITDEQYQELVQSPIIKQNKNKHFQQLQNDGEIKKEKIIAISNKQIISEKTIESSDFGKYIENLQQTTSIKTIEKIHKLTIIKSVNDEEYKDLMWIVQDINGREKFGVHMTDEDFYAFHLKNVLGLKEMIVKIKYTIYENQIGEQTIKNKEIIVVYSYNDTQRIDLPKEYIIEPAPLELWNTKKDDFLVLEKDIKQSPYCNQVSLFDNDDD